MIEVASNIVLRRPFGDERPITLEEKENFFMERSKAAVQPIPAELAKTPEQRRAISATSYWIQEEIINLGLLYPFAVSPDEVHIFPREAFYNLHPETRSSSDQCSGKYLPKLGSIHLAEPIENLAAFTRRVMHESIHKASYHILVLNNDGTTGAPRVGYNDGRFGGLSFFALNETVSERAAKHILDKKSSNLKDFPELSKKDFDEVTGSYLGFQPLFDLIIDRIAKIRRTHPDEVWISMYKHLFTGENQHLESIDEMFGENSLESIRLIGTNMFKSFFDIQHKYIQYFSTNDKGLRDQLGAELAEYYNPYSF